MSEKPLVLAIHLPQFHPTPENDEWWGKGFTEWTNVVDAKPLFKGHYQPHLPADLGFYDLRLAETREAQAEMARAYGIDGFCYYHYWFHGKRMLHEPIDGILKEKKPEFPFCYFWANESWSRRWTGDDRKLLIEQKYSEEDDRQHALWCLESFKDERYIKVNGRPLFLIYKPYDLPNPQRTFAIFEEVCQEHGVPKPFFVASNSHNKEIDPYSLGFDHAIHFQTRHQLLSEFMIEGPSLKKTIRNLLLGIFSSRLRVYEYKQYKERAAKLKFDYEGFPCVNVTFDNTARRGSKAIVIKDQDPDLFEESLLLAKSDAERLKPGEKIIFINAWNEWAEGNHLEPDMKFGYAFLDKVKKVFS
jgi:lipopolysaccharide biosynthesis protein